MWDDIKLKDICKIKPAKKQVKDIMAEEDQVSFVPMDNLGIDKKHFRSTQKRDLGSVYKGYTYFGDNDVLLAKITPCFENGKLGIAKNLINGIGFGSSEFLVFRSKENLFPEYLYYFLSRASFRENGAKFMTGAVGHKRIPMDFIENIDIPLPPLEEQKRIVAILDEAFAGIDKAIENTEKNLANAKELFESYLNNLSYKKSPMGNLVTIKTGRLNANAAVESGEYPFFTCSREIYKIDHYAFDREAILLAGNNASGDFNVKHYAGKFNAYQRTYVISINNVDQLLYRFLYFQLVKSLKELKNSSIGVGTKFLKIDMIKNLQISLPPIEEQKDILKSLEGLLESSKELEDIYKQKLTALMELKQSLMQKAFAGELTSDMRDVA
ncbi:restriction endonuclease subunit S [Kiloniella majae]|uniref:restriction endonuclease subunit S n=1 Tax=Kiloniella majae TaxID=1938558 RepID=UPI000A277197|nr:restriction endonuclease subunit S [Kiloniella majae]